MEINDLPESLFAPIKRHSALIRVFISPREDRYEGVAFVLRGRQRMPIDMKTLLKKYRTLKGKNIRAMTLVGGRKYWFRSPAGGQGRVFITPKSGKREFKFNGQPLKPMTCVVFSADAAEVMPYAVFRAQYRMLPNAVSSRSANNPKPRQQGVYPQQTQTNSEPFTKPRVVAPVRSAPNNPPIVQRPTRPAPSTQPTEQTQLCEYTPLARLVRDGKPMGLQLRNSKGQVSRIGMEKCVMWARDGKIAGVKAVTRNGVSFVAGVGQSLEALPQMEV